MSRLELNSSFNKDATRIIRALEDYGWHFTMKRKGHAIGRAPDDETTCSIAAGLSPRNRGLQNAEAVVKRWERKLEADRLATQAGAALVRADFLENDSVIDDVIIAGATRKARLAMDVLNESKEPTVVSRAPWKARQGTSRANATTNYYESGAVVEVLWSDGSMTYECSLATCDYAAEKPHSVSSHFRAHVRAGEADPVSGNAYPRPNVARAIPVDPESIGNGYNGKHTTYSPSERLLAALAAFLDDTWKEGSWDPEAIARIALTWVHDRPDLGDVEARQSEPLSSEQIVQKIRLLVGGRDVELEEAHQSALQTVERLRTEMADAQAEVARLTEVAALAQAEATRVQGDLDAWLSLAPRPKESA